MKSNPRLRPFTLTVSAALATLLITPALWPEMEKRFMNWAVPEDAAPQAGADSTARQAQNPAATSIVHGAISGLAAASSREWEGLPRGAAWPQITSFDLEFAHLEDTFHNASQCALTVPAYVSALTAFAKDRVSEETLQDPDFGATFLAMDSPLVRRWGLAFHGSRNGGVDLSDEALRTYAANLLATLETSAEGSATWTSSDSLVSISVNTGAFDGRSFGSPGYSAAVWTPPDVPPASVVVVNAPQPQAWSGFVEAPRPVTGSNPVWPGRSASISLPAKLRPLLSTTAPSPLAAPRSSVADRGVVSGHSNPFASLRNTIAPNVPSSFISGPASIGSRLRSDGGGSGMPVASGDVVPPISTTPVHAQSGGLTINPTWDSTITSDPNAATIEASIQTAINTLQSYIANPITVNITFSEMTTGLAQSSTNSYFTSYASYVTALKNQSRTSNDNLAILSLGSNTATNPVNGTVNIDPTTALEAGLGVNITQNGTSFGTVSSFGVTPTGTVSLNTSLMNLSRTGTQNGSKYDLQAAVTHEMDEILGTGGQGSQLREGGSTTGDIGPLDLYRYSSNGVRSYSVSPGPDPYFSINGGVTKLVYWNQEGAADGADMADWGNGITGAEYGNTPPNVQDAYGTPGAQVNLGIYELTALDVAGWNLTNAGLAVEGLPEPDSPALLAGAAITLLVVHRRRKNVAA